MAIKVLYAKEGTIQAIPSRGIVIFHLYNRHLITKSLRKKLTFLIQCFDFKLKLFSKICHSLVLLLLEACPEQSCVVCEYIENIILKNRFMRKNNTSLIAWYGGFRIAWEVRSALSFHHNNKP